MDRSLIYLLKNCAINYFLLIREIKFLCTKNFVLKYFTKNDYTTLLYSLKVLYKKNGAINSVPISLY